MSMAMGTDEQRDAGYEPRDATETTPSQENLALFYQGLLTGIVRLQSQRQHISDAESFRRRTKATLHEVEQVAIAAGYDGRDVQDTHFAVVAFLDAVVLNSRDPIRGEWERKPLQEELFGKAEAGVVFCAKLDAFRARRDSAQLADILEVYLLCLLLGFEGRYAGGMRGELESITHRIRKRIQDIRGRSRQLSPSGFLPPDLAPLAPVSRGQDRFRLVMLAAVICTILCFGLFFLLLNSNLSQTNEQLRRLF
jgi:type VI secretion system protein ImpK